MEINAKIYAVADSEELLQRIGRILSEKTFDDDVSIQAMEPCAALRVTRTWYGFSTRAEPVHGPEDWMDCMQECAEVLKKNGAVEVEFWSPDAPDDYLEYAYTTPGGNAGHARRSALPAYRRALGNDDILLAIRELYSERTARDRLFASRRREKKEAARREKGDFEITPDGVLKRYRGHDLDVVIPDGVKEIGESAFVDHKGLERFLVECEDYDAPEMTSLTLPGSVEKIGSYAFAYCLNLEKVEMTNSVRSIGSRAFEGCESLKSIRLSESLSEIEELTFFLCDSLRSITIPEGTAFIANEAFLDCSSLKKVTFPESLKCIGKGAFLGTALASIVLPRGVQEIDASAFPKDTVLKRK